MKYGIKNIAQGRSDIFHVDPKILQTKPGWNSRDADHPDNLAHIDTLAQSIASVGVKEPLTVYWEDDAPFVSDGHCRLAAALRAIEVYGADLKTVPVKTEGRFTSEAERVFSQIVRNSGKPLAPLEQARVFKRLVDLGWNEKEIADKSGMSKQRIVDLLELQAAPEDVQALIRDGKVSATLAMQTLRESGVKSAGNVLRKAVERAAAAGKTKATPKHVAGEKGPSIKTELRTLFTAPVENAGFLWIKMTADDHARFASWLGVKPKEGGAE